MSNTANNLRKRIHAVGLHNMKRAIAYGIQQKGERDTMVRTREVLESVINSTLIDRLVWWGLTPEGHNYWDRICVIERNRE